MKEIIDYVVSLTNMEINVSNMDQTDKILNVIQYFKFFKFLFIGSNPKYDEI